MIPEKYRTKCDNCPRNKECFKEGKLFAYFVSDDPYLASEYGYRGSHGMLKLDAICPNEGKTVITIGKEPKNG